MDDYQQRKHVRADWHDYNDGLYFITICENEKKHVFGHISQGEMHYSRLGKETCNLISAIPGHCADAYIINSVVMPNHIHLVISINNTRNPSTNNHVQNNLRQFGGRQPRLSTVISGFKAAVTRFARRNGIFFEWQSGYHEHIIRKRDTYDNIMRYVQENVMRWDTDRFNENR